MCVADFHLLRMAAFNGVVHVLKNAEIVLGFKFDELVSIVDSLVVRNDFILIPDFFFLVQLDFSCSLR